MSETGRMENFAELLEEYSVSHEITTGEVITAEIIGIDNNVVTVNAGLKSEAWIDINEFKDINGELEVKVGDFVTVVIESIENGFGETKLSREKAKRIADWLVLEKALETGAILSGCINGQIKGGLTVMVNSVRAFLPGSLIDVHPIKDTALYEGKEIEFKVIKLDKKRNNVVVSRRAVLEETLGEERRALLENLTEGSIVKGVVKNLTDYGAFVDLGGIDGLLHITDLAWNRVKHPSELLEIGKEVEAKVLKFDKEKNRVSLGLKQLTDDPWVGLSNSHPAGTIMQGKVSNLTDYGAFVKIQTGIEGLVHVSEMDWTNKNVHPSKMVQVGDEIQVMILDIDENRHRISLGMKQCQPNPWENFAVNYQKGDKLSGVIRSITDFGIFIGLPGNIDGLVHLSDLSWCESAETALRNYQKGDEIAVVILAIDINKERISLGVKQLEKDNFSDYIDNHAQGSTVKGKIISVESKLAIMELDTDVKGQIHASEILTGKVDDVRDYLQINSEIEAVISAIDYKNRVINLSIKANIEKNQSATFASVNQSNINTGTTSLGDLLKEQFSDSKE